MSAGPDPAPAFAGALPAGRPALAVVAFSGKTEVRWLRWLKPGFRHCLVALYDGRRWVLYDPLAHVTELVVLPAEARFDPVAWFLAHGYLPVPVRPRPAVRRVAPLAPFTCVEAVKRVLGIRARRVATPWQLFRHLTGVRKKVLDRATE